jgi:hypothetical protein
MATSYQISADSRYFFMGGVSAKVVLQMLLRRLEKIYHC